MVLHQESELVFIVQIYSKCSAMDNLDLNSDETIIQKTQTIIINGVRHEAVLTSRRLILVESETGHINEDIPFADIGLAASGVNRIREPIITLSFNSPEGEKRTLELIFIHLVAGQNIKEIEKCLAILKQYNVPVEGKVQLAGPTFLSKRDRTDTGESVVEEKVSRPAVPEWTILGTSHKGRQPLPAEAPQQSPLILIAAVVIIIVVFVSGAFIVGQAMNAKNVPVHQNVTGPDTTKVVVPSPSLTPTPIPQIPVTPAPGASVPPIAIPTDGVWIQVSYPGNFSGYIGAQGRQIEVNSSGTQFYQVPVHDAMIEGSIEKKDGSADKIEVGIYNGGTLIAKSETKKPQGVVDIHVMVGSVITNSAVIAPPPPEIQVSPYASLPQVSIPPSGIWVRVFYPGNFIGSIRANGQLKNVNSTGDQLYQLPIASGMIDGSIEKQDGSVKNLIIEVYKDGALISQSYTSTPLGVVDIHTKV
jgi:hypothetical protein